MPATMLRFFEASGLSVCCAFAILTASPKRASSLGVVAMHASKVGHVVAHACSARTAAAANRSFDVAARFIVRSFISLRIRLALWAQQGLVPAPVAAGTPGR